jgi:hypothetical protein
MKYEKKHGGEDQQAKNIAKRKHEKMKAKALDIDGDVFFLLLLFRAK